MVFFPIILGHPYWCAHWNNFRRFYALAINQISCCVYTMVLAANDRLNISAQKAIHLGADHVFRAFDYHGSKPRGFSPLISCRADE